MSRITLIVRFHNVKFDNKDLPDLVLRDEDVSSDTVALLKRDAERLLTKIKAARESAESLVSELEGNDE